MQGSNRHSSVYQNLYCLDPGIYLRQEYPYKHLRQNLDLILVMLFLFLQHRSKDYLIMYKVFYKLNLMQHRYLISTVGFDLVHLHTAYSYPIRTEVMLRNGYSSSLLRNLHCVSLLHRVYCIR